MQRKDKLFAQSNNIKALLNFGSRLDNDMVEVASNEHKRSELVLNLVTLVETHRFDGLYCSWHFSFAILVRCMTNDI